MRLEEVHAALRESTVNLPIPELALAVGHITTAAAIISSVAEGTDRLDGALSDTMQGGSRCKVAGHLFRLADDRLMAYVQETGGNPYFDGGSTHESDNELTAQQRQERHEARVMTRVTDTFRGLKELKNFMAVGFNIDPYQLIRNKVVCDMGSGWGGLAKTAITEKTGATVHCVNPRLRDPALKVREELVGRKALQRQYPKLSEKDLERIQNTHDKFLRTEFAHNVSLPDESVDVVIDSIAVHTYISHNPDLYRQTIAQYARILRPDGLVIVLDAAFGRQRSAAEIQFRQRVAYEAGLRYRPVTNAYYDALHGAILWKRSTEAPDKANMRRKGIWKI